MPNKSLLIDASVVTESDVEQHNVYTILTKAPPDGMGLKKEDILTKHNVRGMLISKRANKKNHFPDYVIGINGLPAVVIEVKKPNEDLFEAFGEARLYATEINSLYPTRVNPLTKLVATDGKKWLLGYWDSDNIEIDVTELNSFSENFTSFINFLKRSTLLKDIDLINKKLFPNVYYQPWRYVGGERVQNEEIGFNSFGDKLISQYRNIFNPNSVEDRKFIAINGYISSNKNRRYHDPINNVINSRVLDYSLDGTLINDLKNPRELVDGLKKKKELEGKIILLIGSVGSGKTTFIDHLIEKVIPDDIKRETLWIRINMNNSPVNRDEIYNWIREGIIRECELLHPEIDFHSMEAMLKIYSVEVNNFNKGLGAILNDEKERNRELFNIIKENETNLDKKATCYTRYLGSERNKLIIIVLDNCDKRTRDEQLLMFEVAQWLQNYFRVLIMLPLRDETYDNHRNSPPLDTAIKDMVFKIEPPMFQEVLLSRVQLILNKMNVFNNRIQYDLGNGMSVECGRDEESIYLTSIVKAIFIYDKEIRRIIVGLAGKNIRRALEIFMEFCTSGHITSGEILKIRQQQGSYSLPLHIITKVLLRMNKRFYRSDSSYLKNLFSITTDDPFPNYFTRYIILKWFHDKYSSVGTSGYKGYFSIRDLKEEIVKYGISEDVIFREVNYLIKGFCLESERFTTDIVDENDLLKITSTGFVHLDMVSNINYLAAISEDTHYSSDSIAKEIAGTMGEKESLYDKKIVAKNAKIIMDYLSEWQGKHDSLTNNLLSDNEFSILSDFNNAKECVHRFNESLKDPLWTEFESNHQIGEPIDGIIKNVHDRYGIFVELSSQGDITGLIYKSKCPDDYTRKYKKNDAISVMIDNEIDIVNKKISLSIVGLH
ncbi:type I restriction endonuclease [Morganella morganii]|uniref:type I restriction endonuclease n=1 Tax=Morganella morganii TaxID=582 RepID=UPI00339C6CCD